MRFGALAPGIILTANLFAQTRNGSAHRFSWQTYCFEHPSAPFCAGHEMAVKHRPPGKDPQPSTGVITNPVPAAPQAASPSVIVVGGGIDWRFADPVAEGIACFQTGALSTSPLARRLFLQSGVEHGLDEAGLNRMFDALAGLDQVALSLREGHIVAMAVSFSGDLAVPPVPPGLKALPVSRNAVLIGEAGAVDQAARRIDAKSAGKDAAATPDEVLAAADFWIAGSGGLVGRQAASAGVKRFSLSVSIRDQVTSDVTFEFDHPPRSEAIHAWEASLGPSMAEQNLVRFRMSAAAGEAPRRLGRVAAAALNVSWTDLFDGMKRLPARDPGEHPRPKAVIYGLDGGPREIEQRPGR